MSKFPVFPVHVLYDSRVIDEEQIKNALQIIVEIQSSDPVVAEAVRINLIRIGRCLDGPCDPKTFISKLEADADLLDLKSAFEMVASDHQILNRTKQGFGNPETLLLIGSESLSDWLLGWRQLEIFRTLTLAYWVSDHQLDETERKEKAKWLAKISPSEPSQALRYKIVELPDAEHVAFLNDVFERLKVRLNQRVHQSGPFQMDSSTL